MTVYKIGDTVQVVVTVKNNSAAPATGTSVNIPLTELVGLLYSSHVADQGTFDGTDWTVGTVAALDEVSLTIDLSVEDDCTEVFGPMTCVVTSDNDLVESNNTIVKTVEGGVPCCEIQECIGDGLRPYQTYVALITQEGTGDPVPIVLENTLGQDITWTYGSTGEYFGGATGAFPENRTWMLIGQHGDYADPARIARTDDNTVKLDTRGASGAFEDEILTNASLEIRVYPLVVT